MQLKHTQRQRSAGDADGADTGGSGIDSGVSTFIVTETPVSALHPKRLVAQLVSAAHEVNGQRRRRPERRVDPYSTFA